LENSTDFFAELRQAQSYRENGQHKLAAAVYREILTRQPDHYEANYSLGMLCHELGRNDLAIPLIEKSVETRPDIFAGFINLGMIQRDEGLLEDSLINLKRAVALKPDSAEAHVTLGLLYIDRVEMDLALEEMAHGLRLDPENPMTNARMGMLQQILGAKDEASSCFRKVIDLSPNDINARRSLVFLQKQTDYNNNIKWLEDSFASPECSDQDRLLLGYTLGKAFDDLGQYDKAFHCLRTAHKFQRQLSPYSIEKQKVSFERHRQELDRELLRHCKDHVVSDRTPVFVLGMPRSGTSLVEQILASHPLAYGAGEVEYMRFFAIAAERTTGKPFPLDIKKVPPQTLKEAGEAYVKNLKLNAGPARRVIDKLPHNFLRVGLIAAVMPNAKIVLCQREPMDACLSIYQHFFGKAHGYASDLSELGHYYRLYQDLMDWWEEILPGHMHLVNYEELISETERQVMEMLGYCGLPFHENCLSFHQTQRQVKTPSAAQVRQPIYQHSIGRWKNYEKHLEPLRKALERD
jgi:tetratricopeptide (TPR) repeat protein